MKKYENIANFVLRRIQNGDYSLKDFPAERQLAAEVGVSYMTVRKAIRSLVDDGRLVRRPNGRVGVPRTTGGQGRPLQVAFLAPTFNSPVIEQWDVALDKVLGSPDRGVVRPVLYMHWDDPVVQDSLKGFDGVFLVPLPEPIPAPVAQRLSKARRLVVIDDDMSHLGIPSVRLFPPIFVQRLLDHLAALGHEHIDCFNLHRMHPVIEQRIEQWNLWRLAHGCKGRLINGPYREPTAALLPGYQALKRELESGTFHATALLCITAPAAIVAMRVLHEHGLKPGRDVAVCTINTEGMGDMLVPSLTAIELPDASPYVACCLDWIANGGERWIGPLLVQPAEVPLVIRESSGSRRDASP